MDVNFISIKNMKWEFGKSSKPFYFQVRESPSTFRLPPLHSTTFLGDTMNSKQRRSSELGGNECGISKSNNRHKNDGLLGLF